MKKVITGAIFIVLICVIGIYAYRNYVNKNNFQLTDLDELGTGEKIMWTDNSMYNKYDINFGTLNGSDTKEIISKKSSYDMKINVDDESGTLNLKIYNDSKVLFNKKGSINETITVGDNDSKDVKIQLSGTKAKGHVSINLS